MFDRTQFFKNEFLSDDIQIVRVKPPSDESDNEDKELDLDELLEEPLRTAQQN